MSALPRKKTWKKKKTTQEMQNLIDNAVMIRDGIEKEDKKTHVVVVNEIKMPSTLGIKKRQPKK